MTRGLDAAALAAISGAKVVEVHLVELELDTTTLRMTDAYRDLDWNGANYYRGGNLLGISDINDSAALTVSEVTVTLNGVNQAMTALVLQEQYLDRPLTIRRGYLDAQGELVSVHTLFTGHVNRPAIVDDPTSGTSTVALTVGNIWVDFERRPGRTTNHEHQQSFFPGDRGFEFAAEVFKDLPWGRTE